MEMLMHFLLRYLCLTIVVVFSLVLLNIIHNYCKQKKTSLNSLQKFGLYVILVLLSILSATAAISFSRNIPAKPESGDSVIAAGIN